MDKYKLILKKLKKLKKKTLIQLIKRLEKEVARLNGALDRITESQDRLQEKYKDLQVTHELQKADFAAVTDGMSGQEIAQQIQESKDFSLEEEEEIGWVITYTESGRTEQDTAELVAASSQEAKDKFLETMEYTNRTCHEASPKMFPNRDFTYKILSVEPKEVEEIEWRVTYTSNEDVKGYEQHCERIAAASPAEARDKLLTKLLWDSLRIRVISVKSLEKEVW